MWRNKDRCIRRRALVIDHATPRPDHDAGSYAAIQEMRLLQSHGFKLTFVATDLAHAGRYTIDLQKMGIECPHAPFYVSIPDLLQKRGEEFDLVFITRYGVAEKYIDAIREHTAAKVLFNNADLHFLRELRSRIAAGDPDLSPVIETRNRELALIEKVDAVLSYNEAEHAVIQSHILRGDNVFKCPWVVDGRGHRTPFEAREGIAFLGGYRHPPNIQAVAFLAERIMPLLRATGRKITVRIHGSHVPEAFDAWAADDFVIAGFAEDLDDVFERCRVFVAPLQSGAGIKGKVVEAMSRGVPCVLSPIAAEATGLSNGVSATIAETPQEWVDAILQLYDDQQKWAAYSANALALARNNHSFEVGRAMMGKALAYLGFFSGPAQAWAVPKFPRTQDREAGAS